MNRRTVLALLASAVGTSAGCLGPPVGGDGRDGDRTPDTPESTRIVSRNLIRTGDCERPETANVTVDAGTVRVTGCVTGPNGCAVAALGSVALADGRLEVVVTTERETQGDVGCTQALVYRGYEAVVRFDGPSPDRVTVIHDAPGERTTVAEVDT